MDDKQRKAFWASPDGQAIKETESYKIWFKEYRKAWYQENRDDMLEYRKVWYQENSSKTIL